MNCLVLDPYFSQASSITLLSPEFAWITGNSLALDTQTLAKALLYPDLVCLIMNCLALDPYFTQTSSITLLSPEFDWITGHSLALDTQTLAKEFQYHCSSLILSGSPSFLWQSTQSTSLNHLVLTNTFTLCILYFHCFI